ncbi:MAG: fasciclin domain-containing protein [Saprospiraceae bacterium]
MKNLSLLKLLSLLLILVTAASCGTDDDTVTDPDPVVLKNIVELATDDGNFDLLIAATNKAGLIPTLSSDAASFTIFAPTDNVFQTFLDAQGVTLEQLDTPTVQLILTNHAFAGKIASSSLATQYYTSRSPIGFYQVDADPSNDGITASMYVNIDNGDVQINGGDPATGGAVVVEADIEASNGFLHKINGVIAPPTLATFASSDPRFASLLGALAKVSADPAQPNLVALLSDPNPANGVYTVFAPDNTAFANWLTANNTTLADVDVATLANRIKYHVIPGANVRQADITNGLEAATLTGNNITLVIDGASYSVNVFGNNSANITETDIQSQNGVIHIIDSVLEE